MSLPSSVPNIDISIGLFIAKLKYLANTNSNNCMLHSLTHKISCTITKSRNKTIHTIQIKWSSTRLWRRFLWAPTNALLAHFQLVMNKVIMNFRMHDQKISKLYRQLATYGWLSFTRSRRSLLRRGGRLMFFKTTLIMRLNDKSLPRFFVVRGPMEVIFMWRGAKFIPLESVWG